MSRVRTQPCEACPFRKDVPSGVWAAEEYLKLPPYDAPTDQQPVEPFKCHATPEFFCHGWAVVGSSRGHDHELISLRFAQLFGGEWIEIPEPTVPLFASGTEAAEHGLRGIRRPGKRARATQARLKQRYARLREEEKVPGKEDADGELVGRKVTSSKRPGDQTVAPLGNNGTRPHMSTFYVGRTGNGSSTHVSRYKGAAVHALCGRYIWTRTRLPLAGQPTCRRCQAALERLGQDQRDPSPELEAALKDRPIE